MRVRSEASRSPSLRRTRSSRVIASSRHRVIADASWRHKSAIALRSREHLRERRRKRGRITTKAWSRAQKHRADPGGGFAARTRCAVLQSLITRDATCAPRGPRSICDAADAICLEQRRVKVQDEREAELGEPQIRECLTHMCIADRGRRLEFDDQSVVDDQVGNELADADAFVGHGHRRLCPERNALKLELDPKRSLVDGLEVPRAKVAMYCHRGADHAVRELVESLIDGSELRGGCDGVSGLGGLRVHSSIIDRASDMSIAISADASSESRTCGAVLPFVRVLEARSRSRVGGAAAIRGLLCAFVPSTRPLW